MNKKDKEEYKKIKYIPTLRYKGSKGKLWRTLSDYVRIRDFCKYKYCVSCYKTINEWRDFDAGHFVAVGSSTGFLQFWHENIHGQCRHCNSLSSFDMGENFAREIDNRYGEGKAQQLRQLKSKYAGYRESDYIQMTLENIEKLKELKNDYGICTDYLI